MKDAFQKSVIFKKVEQTETVLMLTAVSADQNQTNHRNSKEDLWLRTSI